MIVRRICKAAFPATDGEGARLYGGRWNHKGTPMIYCAKTASLYALEVLVNSAVLPSNRVIIEAHISPKLHLEETDIASLPPDWKNPVPTDSTKDIGTDWAKRMDTAVLSVPSAVVDRERNFLGSVNPRHPDFHHIKFDPPEPFDFDPRLK